MLSLSLLFCTACGGGDDDDNGGGSSSAQANSNRNVSASQPEISRLEFPKVKGDNNSFVVIHKVNNAPDPDGVNYSIEWDKSKKAQRWTCYQMKTPTSPPLTDWTTHNPITPAQDSPGDISSPLPTASIPCLPTNRHSTTVICTRSITPLMPATITAVRG